MKKDQDIIDLSPEQIAIGELLLKEGFLKYDGVFQAFQSKPIEKEEWRVHEIDTEKFSHMKRIHEIHYLAYSQEMKHFSVVVKFDKPKGEAGGGMRKWRSTMIPRVISDVNIAREFLAGMFGSADKPVKPSADSEATIVAAYLMGVIDELVCSDGKFRDAAERYQIARDAKIVMQEKGYIK